MEPPFPQNSAQDFEKALIRERKARERAEAILESKSRELFIASQDLQQQYLAIERRTVELDFLNSIALAARDADDFNQTMKLFIDAVCAFCHWPVAHVFGFAKGDYRELISLGIWHIDPDVDIGKFKEVTEQCRFGKGEGLPGQTFAEEKPVWVENIHTAPNFPRAKLVDHLPLYSAFAVPIRVYHTTFAVAEFFTLETKKRDERLLRVVETAVIQLGTSLEREQSESEIRESFQQLEKAHKDLKQTQTQLVQTEKMASLGQLAAGVAHEINNPMGFIMSNMRTMKEYVDTFKKLLTQYESLAATLTAKSPEQEKLLQEIDSLRATEDLAYILKDVDQLLSESIHGADRVKEIVQGLKSFARLDESEVKEANVNDCVEATLKIIWNELKYKCQVHKNLGVLPMIRCYPGQLNQVLINLLVNAAHAIPEKGDVTIETNFAPPHVVIRISDTGKGIAKENLQRIFEPFFTTKAVGQGTGLGLSISYGIIQKHKGTIDVESEVGKGTTFTIRLPIQGVPK